MKKRLTCSHCHRPVVTCICRLVKKITNQTQLIIWQHPSEYGHPKGSAQLLHLCLQNSAIFVGEKFSPLELGIVPEQCALLYPNENNAVEQQETKLQIRQLLLIDGTWRKSRKIIYTNPWLTQLARITIPAEENDYRIRKSESSQQLSSFEAGAIAIDLLDEMQNYNITLKHVFEEFVQQWEHFLPK
ncbi:tRNA-uridine aminocarboxypropyltransferase [Teredinibacter sp. KSP-S5-2]|uniref:tRNA-uridine aminocarboxypropyltransferase n=1 Tax=Teredinibacter sp. KSP-S5-2 TaxID=3034506 RepID=UPI002934C7CC|nr:tRNA-uridine aminocarboxypropyltransferase [Teredinibacter sp. KSP-S5-2]WNO11005.1 DTW domain-containing protein [Teredinibacter sp. KSP-S5-2]